jgi:hypothetical protein
MRIQIANIHVWLEHLNPAFASCHVSINVQTVEHSAVKHWQQVTVNDHLICIVLLALCTS